MLQTEAASHIDELMGALISVLGMKRSRSTLILLAMHDLGNNFYSVVITAGFLGVKETAETERVEFAAILEQGVKSVSVMLGELM
jgi:hypothetical protein